MDTDGTHIPQSCLIFLIKTEVLPPIFQQVNVFVLIYTLVFVGNSEFFSQHRKVLAKMAA
jgi:hypothetical protein